MNVSIPRRTSMPAEAMRVILERIKSARWGEFLPAERRLAEDLQISRTSLRPALKELERQGFLSVVGHKRRIHHKTSRRRRGKSKTVVFLSKVPAERIEPYVLIEIDHLRSLLARKGMVLQIETRPSCYSARPGAALEQLRSELNADCWLLFRSTKPMQEWFEAQGLRRVIFGSAFHPEKSASIDLDYFAVARHAATTFGRLGHRRLALVIPRSGVVGDQASLDGFRAGVSAFDEARFDLFEHDGGPGGIVKAVDALLAREVRPSCIFSAGSIQTITILSRLLQRGIRIPKEISIISRDSGPVMDFMSPSPACYQRPLLKYAHEVLRQIERQLSSIESAPRRVLIFPDFHANATLENRAL